MAQGDIHYMGMLPVAPHMSGVICEQEVIGGSCPPLSAPLGPRLQGIAVLLLQAKEIAYQFHTLCKR